MNKHLMSVVVESLAFWELAGDELVDPEAAAEQTEGAVTALRQMTSEEKAEFVRFVNDYAIEEKRQKGPLERVEFFRTLPETLGLAD
jgi:hypothetical protein